MHFVPQRILSSWDWVDNRNDARYANTIEHGKNYDAKNMIHTFRLLAIAKEIAKEGKVCQKARS